MSRDTRDRLSDSYTVPCRSARVPRVRKMLVTVAGPRWSTQPQAIGRQGRAVGSVKT